MTLEADCKVGADVEVIARLGPRALAAYGFQFRSQGVRMVVVLTNGEELEKDFPSLVEALAEEARILRMWEAAGFPVLAPGGGGGGALGAL